MTVETPSKTKKLSKQERTIEPTGNTGSERERNPSPKDRLKGTKTGIVFDRDTDGQGNDWPSVLKNCRSKKIYPRRRLQQQIRPEKQHREEDLDGHDEALKRSEGLLEAHIVVLVIRG